MLAGVEVNGAPDSAVVVVAGPAIGAAPCTDWLPPAVATDAKGFILTGEAAARGASVLETSVPGVFAAGDVRSGSTKRVASAVGEGAMTVKFVHEYLAAHRATGA